MNSEEDPRSMDWAPKKIRAIELDLANLREIFGDDRRVRERHEQAISGRVWDLEQAEKRMTHLERQSEDLAREVGNQFAEMSRRISGMEDRHRELVKQSADEIEVLSDRVAELQNAIASRVREKLSAGFRQLDEDHIPQFGAPWVEDENIPPGYTVMGAPEEFSPPVGGRRAGDTEDKTHLRGTGAPARNGGIFSIGTPPSVGVVPPDVAEGLVERGYKLGRAAALDEAESRIVAALDKVDIYGRYRDEILSALRGVQAPPVRKIRDNPQG